MAPLTKPDDLADKGNVRSYMERGRKLRWSSDEDLFKTYKNGLCLWSVDPLNFHLMFDADAEFKLRAVAIPFDDECRQLVEQGIARISRPETR